MLLGKSCYKRDNIKTRKTIKLGSLFEYRATENKDIADAEEGIFRFNLWFDGEVTIDGRLFNTMSGGAGQIGPAGGIIFPGRTEAYFERLHIKDTTLDSITLADSKGIITRHALNSFIFCMSHVRQASDCHGIFPNYDDYWYIQESDTDEFGGKLAQHLANQIHKNHKEGSYVIPKNIDPKEIVVHALVDKVSYIDRDIHFNSTSKFELDQIRYKLRDLSFIKPPIPFEKEKETRFQFIITHNDNIIEPLQRNIILDNCENLLPLVF